MGTNKKRALYDFLMTLAATTVSIILTFGTTAIVDRKKNNAEKREMVMMIMYDMRETLEKLERCDQDLNKFFDLQVDLLAHPQRFEDNRIHLEIYLPTSDFTTTTENIFKSNIETIRTIGNILFVETVSSFYDNRSQYKSKVVDAFLHDTEEAIKDIESLRDFNSSGYLFISQAYLGLLNRDFERCKMMMKVSDEDLEVFRTQHQELLDATNENVAEEALKASLENQRRKQKLQQAREEGLKEGR